MLIFLKKITIITFVILFVSLTEANENQDQRIINALEYYLTENEDTLVKDHQVLKQQLKTGNQDLLLTVLFHEFLIADISQKKQKRKYSGLCIKSTEQIIASTEELQSELYAILSACFGLSAEVNLFKAASHGIKSGAMIEKALQLDSNNAFIYLINGTLDYSRPTFAGGSKKNGITNLSKVLELNKDKDDDLSSAVSAMALYHLANIAYQQKQYNQSSQYIERSLRIIPNYKRPQELKEKLRGV